jgi:hypothetical protein
MKYLLALILSVGIITAQDNPIVPMKRLVTSGNGSVTLGQVVAGYSNDFHVGIRPPRRGTLTSVQEQLNTMVASVYPNPANGYVNFRAENLESVEVSDILGNKYNTVDYGSQTITFPYRGTYFVKVRNHVGLTTSIIIINQ